MIDSVFYIRVLKNASKYEGAITKFAIFNVNRTLCILIIIHPFNITFIISILPFYIETLIP